MRLLFLVLCIGTYPTLGSANDFFHFGAELKKIDPKYLRIVADVKIVKAARKVRKKK